MVETQLMVAEKMQIALGPQTNAMLGALGTTPLVAGRRALGHYRRKVAADRRRLSR